MAKPVGRRRVWVRRAIPVIVVVVIVGGVFGTRAVASGGASPSYRLGQVTKGSVQQTLSLTGTAKTVNQTTSSFKVSGTVRRVAVAIGDHVSAGQTIATLDGTTLQQSVISARATLAQAKATLASDEDGTSSGSGSSTGSGSATGSSTGAGSSTGSNVSDTTVSNSLATSNAVVAIDAAYVTSGRPTPPSGGKTPPLPTTPSGAAAAVKQWQATLVADQKAAADALTQLQSAQLDQTNTCAHLSSGSTTHDITDCVNAVQATTAAQTAVSTAQTTVATDESELARQLANQATVDARAGGSGSGGGTGGTGTGGTGGSNRSGSGSGSTSTTVSAERITSDKAAVQTAESALATAQANFADATLTAPIAGTVAALSLVAGTSSGSDSVTVIGAGAVDVTVDVPLASLPKIKTGLAATVSPAASSTPLTGTVHSISLLPASATTTSVSYPVVVRVAHPTPSLASGSSAGVMIILASVADVVTVPNSALTTLVAGTGFVQTMKAGKVTRTLVRTGAVGPTSTQILSGLTVGQQVVIADLNQALPTANTTNRFANRTGGGLTSSLTGAGGGFAGGAGGFGGGGFRPGG